MWENLHQVDVIAMTNLTKYNCSGGVTWIMTIFDQCVVDTRRYIAIISGIVSIVAWAWSAFPQIVDNCRKGMADKAISPYLLGFWTIGDILNLLGCIFTHQLILQYFTAAFSILCDIIMIIQFVIAYVRNRNSRNLALIAAQEASINSENEISVSGIGDTFRAGLPSAILTCLGLSWTFSAFGVGLSVYSHAAEAANVEYTHKSRNLLFHHPIIHDNVFKNGTDIIGYVIGCVSAAFYLSARIPQLYQNYARGCTDGLSVGLFTLCAVGNFTYGLQIFLTSTKTRFILRHFPWILGSMGVLSLDTMMLLQFLYYRSRNRATPEEREDLIGNDDSLIYA